MANTTVTSIQCSCCLKTKKVTDYYISTNDFNKGTGRVSTCKQCILKFIEESDDSTKLHAALRMIDKPFLIDLWQASVEESNRSNAVRKPFSAYMKNVAMMQYKDYTWADSRFDNITTDDLGENDEDVISNDDLNMLVKFFGKGFTKDNYIWLRDEYNDYTSRYAVDSKGLEMLIKQICLVALDIEIRRAKGEKVDTQLKTLQDLLGSSNLKPVQETGANSVEHETFGTLIKKYENEKPIPEPEETWKDIDGIKKYVTAFFTGHLMRMMGKKDLEVEKIYAEEVGKHTVREPERIDEDD